MSDVTRILSAIEQGDSSAADLTTSQGWFHQPRNWFGKILLVVGSLYLLVMVVRYGVRMSLYPQERWTGGSIPIFFHWVLAAFVIALGVYHQVLAPATSDGAHQTGDDGFAAEHYSPVDLLSLWRPCYG